MYRYFIITFLIFVYSHGYSQGCSDAGACSIESLNFEELQVSRISKVKLNLEQSFGLGEKFVFISQTTAGIQYRLGKTSLIELRIPFIVSSGNLGTAAGLGDLLLSINQNVFKTEKSSFNLLLAGRIKSNKADKKYNDNPLPMAYQSSLGTYDIIAGGLMSIKKWDFYAAYQHSFGRNKNEYLVSDTSINENKQYYESNQLKRGDDIYFRARRFFDLKNSNRINVNTLFIYRIQKDEIIKNDKSIALDGSDGLTVNLAIAYSVNIKNNRKLDFSLAFPIVDKDYRSDGLTRNIVFGFRIINL